MFGLAQISNTTFAAVIYKERTTSTPANDSVFLILFNKQGNLIHTPIYLDSMNQEPQMLYSQPINLVVNSNTIEVVKLSMDFNGMPPYDSVLYKFDRLTFDLNGQLLSKTTRKTKLKNFSSIGTVNQVKAYCLKTDNAYYFAFGYGRCMLIKADLNGNYLTQKFLTNDIEEWGFDVLNRDTITITGTVVLSSTENITKGITYVLNNQLEIIRYDTSFSNIFYPYFSSYQEGFAYINFSESKKARVSISDRSTVQFRKIESDRTLFGSLYTIDRFNNSLYYSSSIGYSNAKGNAAYLLYNDYKNSKAYYYLVKIDSFGNIYNTHIKGNVYAENNLDCINNPNERIIPNYTVYATSQVYSSYTSTDINGNYEIDMDTGIIKVSVRPNINFPFLTSSSCSDTQVLYTNTSTDFDSINFGLSKITNCVYNTVNISTSSAFRIGQASTYYVSYCNNGTIASPNTYITVKLDSLLDINSASVAYTTLPNHTYRFNIGNLDFMNLRKFLFCGNASYWCSATQPNTLYRSAHLS